MPAVRTCIVSPEALGPFANGGVGTAAYRLAELLTCHGHDVTLLYTSQVMSHVRSDWQQHYYQSRGIDFVILDEWRDAAGQSVAGIDDRLYRNPDALRAERVSSFLRTHHFSVVYFQDFMGHGLRAIQAKRAGVAFKNTQMVVWCHSSFLWSLRGNGRLVSQRSHLLREAHERLAAQGADVVAAPSQYMCGIVADEWGIPTPRLLPLWNAADEKAPTDIITHRGFRHLVYFGRIERRKGLDLLLDALVASDVLRDKLECVTFLGRQIAIDGLSAREYIARALKNRGIDWQIVDGLNTDEALAWLAQQQDVLVLAPSVLDNVPYAVLEIFLKRLPLISTRVGGIAEIVGSANVEAMLAPAVSVELCRKLEDVLTEQTLTIDYTAGYNPAVAERKILAFHASLCDPAHRHSMNGNAARTHAQSTPDILISEYQAETDGLHQTLASLKQMEKPLTIYLAAGIQTEDFLQTELHKITEQLVSTGSRVIWGCPEESNEAAPADLLIMRAGEILELAALDRLQAALHSGGYALVSGYVRRTHAHCPDATLIQRPVGNALELGCLEESVATTPCLIASGERGQVVRQLGEYQGDVYPVLLECAFATGRAGVLPELIASGGVWRATVRDERSRNRIAGLYSQYQHRLRSELIYPLLLQDEGEGSRDAYRALARTDECVLEKQLSAGPRDDAVSLLVERLAPLVARWSQESPRLYIYGAGDHSKVLLSLFPVLWQWTEAFIDGRRTGHFLGKPCLNPEGMVFPKDATVVYSSRENELAMHARMSGYRIEHVLLYHLLPDAGQAPREAHA